MGAVKLDECVAVLKDLLDNVDKENAAARQKYNEKS